MRFQILSAWIVILKRSVARSEIKKGFVLCTAFSEITVKENDRFITPGKHNLNKKKSSLLW
jgi:hypothetical protein